MAKKKQTNNTESTTKNIPMQRGKLELPKAYSDRLEQTKRQTEYVNNASKPSVSKDIKPTDFLNAFFWDDVTWKAIPINTKKSYIFKVFQALSADTNMSTKMHQLQGCENIQTMEAIRSIYRRAYGEKKLVPSWAWTFWRKRTEERHPVRNATDEQIEALCEYFGFDDPKYARMFWDVNKSECEQFMKTVG